MSAVVLQQPDMVAFADAVAEGVYRRIQEAATPAPTRFTQPSYTTAEAAKALGCHPSHIHHLRKIKRIRPMAGYRCPYRYSGTELAKVLAEER